MDIHVQHLASLCRSCGDKIIIRIHKRNFLANRFVSEIHPIWKDLLLLQDSPNVHPPVKKNQRKKANFNCKWCISLLVEHALIIWDKIKILQVRQQATPKNKQEKWKIWTTFYSCYDDWFFDSCPVEVNRQYHSCFVRSQQIFTLSLRLFLQGTSLLLSKMLQAMLVKPRPLRSVRNHFDHPNDSLQWIILLFSYIKCFLWNHVKPRRVL